MTILDPGADLDLKEARNRNLRISLELMLTPQFKGLTAALDHQGEILRRCGELFDAGQLRVEVAESFPLEQAAAVTQQDQFGDLRVHCPKDLFPSECDRIAVSVRNSSMCG